MKNPILLAALLPLLSVACGGVEEAPTQPMSQSDSALSSTDPLIGTWCQQGWPGCLTISAGGSAILVNYGDVCWVGGESVWSGLTAGSTPGTYTGTRYMYGGGYCDPKPAPQTGTITMTGPNTYSETAGSHSATWTRQ